MTTLYLVRHFALIHQHGAFLVEDAVPGEVLVGFEAVAVHYQCGGGDLHELLGKELLYALVPYQLFGIEGLPFLVHHHYIVADEEIALLLVIAGIVGGKGALHLHAVVIHLGLYALLHVHIGGLCGIVTDVFGGVYAGLHFAMLAVDEGNILGAVDLVKALAGEGGYLLRIVLAGGEEQQKQKGLQPKAGPMAVCAALLPFNHTCAL